VNDAVDLLIVDPHAIHRCGLVTCLCRLDEIGTISEAASTAEARAHPALRSAGLVIVDHDLAGANEFVRDVCSASTARVVVCTSRSDGENLLGVIHSGAVGLMSKQALTEEGLAAGVRAAVTGTCVLTPELLATLASRSVAERNGHQPSGVTLSQLTRRERQVLSLIADGHRTREVAERLSYSERTVKNVLHDILVKLNVRSRSQAVACAVREGLI
jgi:DNA-binding NarL/FixJ family response regulator